MGIWPFRRKSNRRRKSHGGAEVPRSDEDAMRPAGTGHAGSHNVPDIIAGASGPERRLSRRDKKRRSSRESKKLQRNPERHRAYSFSPGRKDSVGVLQDLKRPPVPPLPSNIRKGSEARQSNTENPDAYLAGQKPLRARTEPIQNTQDWQRMPTLHKRSAQDVARRKSSKKRKEDHDREAEIKAMGAYMPTRPAVESGLGSSGRAMKRESRKMRNGLTHGLENRSSDISLPLAGSIHSSLSSNSEKTSYKISAFDALAPRPTIKYADNPRYGPSSSLERSQSRKRRVSERVSIPEEVLKANKRVDDLADDLDAGELRELMERDKKRRERKKTADKAKMERRLARRQEKQRAEEAIAAREGTPPPDNMERGVLGREIVGLGIGTSAVVTSSKRKESIGEDGRPAKRPLDLFKNAQDPNARTGRPFVPRTASLASEVATPGSELSVPVLETAKIGTVAKASPTVTKFPTFPPTKEQTRRGSSISQFAEANKTELVPPLRPESERKNSEGSARGSSAWASFFRRSKTKRSSTPPSFSNTSRDSMPNAQPPARAAYTPVKSNIPKRTMSKFREDLPEFPISPPDSRVQSPEAEPIPIVRSDRDKRASLQTSTEEPSARYDTPTSGYRSLDAGMRNDTPTSGHRSNENPSPEPVAVLSQSLASIDSEGSWLSGRKGGSKRGSAQSRTHPLRDSASSLNKHYKEFSESAEELGIAEDEYFSRLTPAPEDRYRIHRVSTGNPVPSSDDEEGGSLSSPTGSEPTKWGAVGRQPTVVHREPRAKSREGLLNDFESDSFSERTGASDQRRKSYGRRSAILSDEDSSLHRATSVDLGERHARHISAGSARLLDLKRRLSGESKRSSIGSTAKLE